MDRWKKNLVYTLTACLGMACSTPLCSQTATPTDLKKGVRFIPTEMYSDVENDRLLKLYDGLRVADVSDGMDAAGLPGIGLVDPAIHPLWKDQEDFTHRLCGIALTVRYVPSQRPIHPADTADFSRWESNWYQKYSSEPFTAVLQKGHVIVIDDVEEGDIGTIGSNNILGWKRRGAVGVVTDASARDTDEVEKERVPLYLRKVGRGIRPGRNEIESVNCPVSIGGALVCPGDVVVADGDGIIVVPRAVAARVAGIARAVLEGDKAGRRNLYESLGMKKDKTVE